MKLTLACIFFLTALVPVWVRAQNASDIGSYTSSMFLLRNQVDNLADLASAGLAAGRSVPVAVSYDDVTIDGEPGRLFESSTENLSIVGGYFHQWGTFSAGILAGFADSKIDAGPAAGNNNSFATELSGSGYDLALAAAKSWESWTLSGLFGMGSRSYDGMRQFVPPSPNPALPKASSFEPQALFFRLTLAYLFQPSTDWGLRPFVTAAYEVTENDAFQETDVSGLAGDEALVDSFEYSAPFVKAGMEFLYTGSERFTPYLELSFVQNIGDSELELSWSNPPFNASSTIPVPGTSVFVGELGLSTDLGSHWTLSAQADFETGDNYSGLGLRVFGGYGF